MSAIVPESLKVSAPPLKEKSNFFLSFWRKGWRSTDLRCALGLAVFALFYLSTPILSIGDSTYTSSDNLQIHSFFNINPPADFRIVNPSTSDVWMVFHPFHIYNRLSLWSGRLPLWNPYNAGGSPFLGNYSSATFSPFTLPYYFLPFKVAVLVSAFLRLFLLSFFTYLFLRELKLHPLAALLGALAFSYSAYSLVWLNFISTGVIVCLPMACYFAERIFRQFEEKQPAPCYVGLLAGLSFSVWLGLVACHAETFFYSLITFGLYFLFRLVNLWHQTKYSLKFLRRLGWLTLQLMFAGIMGLSLAAIQILPFVEYLGFSYTLSVNEARISEVYLNPNRWALQNFFPDLLGNPVSQYYPPLYTYQEEPGYYISSVAVLMALVSVWFVRRNKYIAYFLSVAVVWLIYAYNIFGFKALTNKVPGLDFGFVNRSHMVWLFSISCCAAILLHYLLVADTGKLKLLKVGSLILSGWLFLVIAIFMARMLIEKEANYLNLFANQFLDYIPAHVWFIGVAYAVGLVALVGLWLAKNRQVRTVLGVGLILAIFAQGGVQFKEYNGTIKDKYVYPYSPAMQTLQKVVGDKTLAVIGWSGFPGDTNLPYKIHIISLYDAMNNKYYNKLARAMFDVGSGELFLLPERSSEKALQMFGVSYFVPYVAGLSLDVGTNYLLQGREEASAEIVSGQAIEQTFSPYSDDLRIIYVYIDALKRQNSCTFNIQLTEGNNLIASRDFNCNTFKEKSFAKLTFAPLKDSASKQFKLTVSSNAEKGNAIAVVTRPQVSGNWLQAGQTKPGMIHFEYLTGNEANFKFVTKARDRQIYQYLGGFSRYYMVDSAIVKPDDAEAFETVLSRDFDPARTVLLSSNPPVSLPPVANPAKAQAVEVLKEEAENIRLKAVRPQPGYLVLTTSHAPGWKAKVNGVEQPVIRANYAFNAVPLGAGENIIEYYYEPNGFRYGLIISLFSLVSGIIIISITLRRRKKTAKAQSN